jgi:hypothetical protein
VSPCHVCDWGNFFVSLLVRQNWTVGDGAVMRGHVKQFVVLFRGSFFFLLFFFFFL